VRYLERAARFGDVLVVGVNSDASVRRLKGPARPLNTERDRAGVIAALDSVDYVTIFTEDTPLELIRLLEPDVLVKGADWKPGAIVGADVVRRRHGAVRTVPLERGRSTTSVIRKIMRGCAR
jgi:D-beta-D-heptose 7-phosphate kinase/D-beta-D-heptose 1-phosphate adenosyltransferase